MKVCLLNESFPPVIDGVVNVVMNYADHMIGDFGAEVMVGTPKYPNADYTQYPYKVIPYPSFNTAKLASGYRAGNPLSSKVIGEMAAFHPDIIHTHCPASATVMARLLREQTGAPVILTYHTKYDIDIARWTSIKPIEQEIVKAMVSNIEGCDEVWTVSRGAGESLKALGFKGDYRVMDNGVDFDKGRVEQEYVDEIVKDYDLPSNLPVFLFVGRLMTYKGLPIILDALKILKENGKDFRMVFVGKGPDRELLEKQAQDNGIGDKCIFVGPVYDRKALRAWNTRADLFLFPSTFDTNGLVVREAAACGLASVLIKDSCASEGITDGRNGFIIEENARSMAVLLMKISGDLNYLHQIGQNAMDEIYLSWKDCVARAYERYQIILDRKACGQLAERRKLALDRVVTLAAREMEEQEKARRIRQEVFYDFHETATGMMDNFRDIRGEYREIRSDYHELLEKMEELRGIEIQGMKDQFQGMKEELEQRTDNKIADVKEQMAGAKNQLIQVKNTLEEHRDNSLTEAKEQIREIREAGETLISKIKEVDSRVTEAENLEDNLAEE